MTNHVHLLVSPHGKTSVSGLMQSLGRRYVQYVNRIYKRSGTPWEGCFKASLVNAEEYLLLCYRYIELNPMPPRAEAALRYATCAFRAHPSCATISMVDPVRLLPASVSDTPAKFRCRTSGCLSGRVSLEPVLERGVQACLPAAP